MTPAQNNQSQISKIRKKKRGKHCVIVAVLGTCSEKHLNEIVIAAKAFLNKGCILQVLKQSFQFSSVTQSCLTLCDPWSATRQASLSIKNSRSLPKLMSIESVISSSHLILCRPLLLPPNPPSIKVFSNESTLCKTWPKYWSFSFSIIPSNMY